MSWLDLTVTLMVKIYRTYSLSHCVYNLWVYYILVLVCIDDELLSSDRTPKLNLIYLLFQKAGRHRGKYTLQEVRSNEAKVSPQQTIISLINEWSTIWTPSSVCVASVVLARTTCSHAPKKEGQICWVGQLWTKWVNKKRKRKRKPDALCSYETRARCRERMSGILLSETNLLNYCPAAVTICHNGETASCCIFWVV